MKTGLVLEGGALRGIFTAGVLDAFMLEGLHFDYAVGVSAGAANIMGLKSRQIGRTANVISVSGNESYFGMTELIHSRQFLNLDKMFDVYGKHPFDFDAYFGDDMEAEYTLCSCETGEAEYFSESSDIERLLKIVKASCSLPMFFAPVEIDGRHYLDGGIGNSIPCDRAIERGCERLVVVLTKPEGTGAGGYSKYKRILKHMYPQYPEFIDACLCRLDRYARSVEYMQKLEQEGRAIVIRPTKHISKFEQDSRKLREYYRNGYKGAQLHMKKVREFLGK